MLLIKVLISDVELMEGFERGMQEELTRIYIYIYITGLKMRYPLDALATAHLTVIVS